MQAAQIPWQDWTGKHVFGLEGREEQGNTAGEGQRLGRRQLRSAQRQILSYRTAQPGLVGAKPSGLEAKRSIEQAPRENRVAFRK